MHHLKHASAWLPLLAGLSLLAGAARLGDLTLALALLPAVLLVGGGLRLLLFTDLRASQLAAVGSVLGLLFAIPIGIFTDPGFALFAALASLLSFMATGWFQIALRPVVEDVPAPPPGLLYGAQVAVDQAILGGMAVLTPSSDPAALGDAVAESEAAFAFLQDSGFLADPRSYHRDPPPLVDYDLTPTRVKKSDCELLHWRSEFEPSAGLPGGQRLLDRVQNRTAQALLLRGEPSAPWLVCVHGFGMGDPLKDLDTFRAARLHAMGLNLALFTLPLHGARASGKISGEGFFGLSPLDFLHAESQAIWDLRRLIGWLRGQGATRLGVYGISLGAYTSAVLVGVEDGLDCVIAGIPPTDMIAHADYLASPVERREALIAGVDPQRDRAIFSVVAPLALTPRVPQPARFMYAATGDQFVPVEQVRALWAHWEQPKISWCRGGHLSALSQRAPRELVQEAVRATLLQEAE